MNARSQHTGWSPKQRKAAAIASKAAAAARGFDERDYVDLLLRQLNGRGKSADGRLSRAAAGLTNRDFEWFMACCEDDLGGRVPGYSPAWFARQLDDRLGRMRYKARGIWRTLVDAGAVEEQTDGRGLDRWLASRVARAGERGVGVETANGDELWSLINQLRAVARQHGIGVPGERTSAAP